MSGETYHFNNGMGGERSIDRCLCNDSHEVHLGESQTESDTDNRKQQLTLGCYTDGMEIGLKAKQQF